jgi:hypothetical protein
MVSAIGWLPARALERLSPIGPNWSDSEPRRNSVFRRPLRPISDIRIRRPTDRRRHEGTTAELPAKRR